MNNSHYSSFHLLISDHKLYLLNLTLSKWLSVNWWFYITKKSYFSFYYIFLTYSLSSKVWLTSTRFTIYAFHFYCNTSVTVTTVLYLWFNDHCCDCVSCQKWQHNNACVEWICVITSIFVCSGWCDDSWVAMSVSIQSE